jgi:hypothetical protein
MLSNNLMALGDKLWAIGKMSIIRNNNFYPWLVSHLPRMQNVYFRNQKSQI